MIMMGWDFLNFLSDVIFHSALLVFVSFLFFGSEEVVGY